MVVDDCGGPVPHFTVRRSWGSEIFLETADLGEAVMFASALALYRGFGVELARAVPTGSTIDPTKSTQLMTFSPSAFDFRKVAPETALAVKSFAHQLIANIDEVAPPADRDGPEK